MLNLSSRLPQLKSDYTTSQLTVLTILRILIGWHFLYEGVVKVLNPNWTSAGFLVESKWIFGPIFNFMATTPVILKIVDFMNMWGLVFIGIGLIVGCFSRLASFSGIFLLLLYYVANPPLIGFKYTAPAEGSYLIVNKNLIEMVTLAALTLFPTGHIIGFDRLINSYKGLRQGDKPAE